MPSSSLDIALTMIMMMTMPLWCRRAGRPYIQLMTQQRRDVRICIYFDGTYFIYERWITTTTRRYITTTRRRGVVTLLVAMVTNQQIYNEIRDFRIMRFSRATCTPDISLTCVYRGPHRYLYFIYTSYIDTYVNIQYIGIHNILRMYSLYRGRNEWFYFYLFDKLCGLKWGNLL